MAVVGMACEKFWRLRAVFGRVATGRGVPCRGALQTADVRFGVVEKLAHKLHNGDLVVGARGDLRRVEVEDLCAGKGEEERGIGGDDELGVVVHEGLEESEHGGLALRREGAFGRID